MAGPLRSSQWFDSPELYGWTRNAALLGQGFERGTFAGKPIIGIGNSWSELTHCNQHLRQLADAVKRGVWQAGGLPLEFPVMSLGEFNIRPTAMFLRNLMAMEIEESIRANPLDGVVLLAGCDKTTAAALMGLASADLPTVLVTGGPQLNAHWRGETLGSCTDCRRYQNELRAGRISTEEWLDLQTQMIRSAGHCMTMGTASTLAILAEVLGIALPGNGAIPGADSGRARLAEAAGRAAVEAVRADRRPSRIMTAAAFDNAIRVLHAVAGSTNAIVHLVALAGRVGVDVPLRRFDELSRSTPTLVNLKPTGSYLMEDFYYAGGVAALCRELGELLDLTASGITGATLADLIASAKNHNPDVLRPRSNPMHSDGGLAVLTGSLAPGGAVIKQSAASPRLLQHRGRAVVFEDHDDLLARIDSPDLDVTADDILVMKGGGPVGGPGMPEWGFLPIPAKLLRAGVRDMVRLSDARMSGTAFGTVVVHVTPESAVGGPLAAVRNGDWIELDVPNRKLNLLIEDDKLKQRQAELPRRRDAPARGYARLFHEHVLQADRGCDFDFLVGRDGSGE